MQQKSWTRSHPSDWPGDKPVWTIASLILSIALAVTLIVLTYLAWLPLQRHFLEQYCWATWGHGKFHIRLLTVRDPHTNDYTWPTNEQMQAGQTVLDSEKTVPFQLNDQAAQEGYTLLLLPKHDIRQADLLDGLRRWVYQGLTLNELVRFTVAEPLEDAGIFLLICLCVAIPKDRKRALTRKYGRHVAGPEMVSAAEFNRRYKSTGIGFVTLEKPALADRILRREYATVRIPKSLEDYHGVCMGGSGNGKNIILEQIAAQIEERGEAAVIYDPGQQVIGKFFRPERGDIHLNAQDVLMPYWSPADEITHPAEALAIAHALFPEKPGEDPFFAEGARKIMARLLNLKPTPSQLIEWLSDVKEIDRRMQGTPQAGMIFRDAGPQRGGMFGSLSMIADSLQLLPRKEECRRSWTATEWAKTRDGWIFITSAPEFRAQVLPLISMWMDVLILRGMNQGKPGPRRTWYLLDEVQTLHKLPQLTTALEENRKSYSPLWLFFQGPSQLEALYGKVAENMLSLLKTKIFLGNDEPRAARWVSDSIGDVAWEYLEETRSDSLMPPHRETRMYRINRETRPLVPREEIQGAGKGYGWVKLGNLVTRISFPFIPRPQRHPGFVLRKASFEPPVPPAPESSGNGSAPSSNDDGATPGNDTGKSVKKPLWK